MQAGQIPDPETDRDAARNRPPPDPSPAPGMVRSGGSADLQSAWARDAGR